MLAVVAEKLLKAGNTQRPFYFFAVALQPKSGPGRLVLKFPDHTKLETHTR